MKPPIPVGVAKIGIQGTFAPATWAVIWYAAIGSWDPAHLNDVIGLVGDRVGHFFNDVLKPEASYNFKTVLYKVGFRDAAGSLYRATVADAQVGAKSGDYQDAQVAWLFNWTTNDDRRGGKPRSYFPGVPSSAMADSAAILSSVQTNINTPLVTWLSDNLTAAHGTASGFQLLELSFVDGGVDRTTAADWPVRAGILNPWVATQRRRVDRLRA